MVKILLEASADVNAKTSNGGTALLYAAGKGNEEIVKLLLNQKADVNATTNSGFNALILASGKDL